MKATIATFQLPLNGFINSRCCKKRRQVLRRNSGAVKAAIGKGIVVENPVRQLRYGGDARHSEKQEDKVKRYIQGVSAAAVVVVSFCLAVSDSIAADKSTIPASTAAAPAAVKTTPSMTAQRKPVVVEVKNVLMVLGAKAAPVTVTVKTIDGAPVKQGGVTFKLNGAPIDALVAGFPAHSMKPGDDGYVIWSMPSEVNSYYKQLHMGANTLEAEFSGSSEYEPGKGTGNIAVMKAATKMADLSLLGGEGPENRRTIKGRLTRITDDSGLDGRAVVVTLGGNKIGTAATDKGSFELMHDLTDAERGKPIRIKAAFEGDTLYLATAEERDVTIAAAPVDVYYVFKPVPPAVAFGQAVQVEAFMSRASIAQGQVPVAPYANKHVCLAINGSRRPDDATSDATGKVIFKFTIDQEAGGKLTVDDCGGLYTSTRDRFHPAGDPASLLVMPTPTQISIVSSPASASIGEHVQIKARLIAGSKPPANRALSITLEGQPGNPAVTNSNGEAVFSEVISPATGIGSKKFAVTFTPNTPSAKDSLIGSSVEHGIQINPKTN